MTWFCWNIQTPTQGTADIFNQYRAWIDCKNLIFYAVVALDQSRGLSIKINLSQLFHYVPECLEHQLLFKWNTLTESYLKSCKCMIRISIKIRPTQDWQQFHKFSKQWFFFLWKSETTKAIISLKGTFRLLFSFEQQMYASRLEWYNVPPVDMIHLTLAPLYIFLIHLEQLERFEKKASTTDCEIWFFLYKYLETSIFKNSYTK